MTHDPREALEPCPFCGTELDIDRNISDTGVYWVMCHQCCAEGPPVNPKAEAIKAWNTRALTASPGEQEPVVEGYVLVPVEPTPEIIRAMHHKIDWCRDDQNTYEVEHPSQNPNGVGTTCKQDICDAYRAMIEALRREAPAPEGVVKGPIFGGTALCGHHVMAAICEKCIRPDAGGWVREAEHKVERILTRRVLQGRVDGYTLETSKEIVAALSTQPAAAESNASVEARLRERVHFYRNHSDAPVYSGKHVANILETVFALAAVGDEANESRRYALAQSEDGK